MVQTFIYTKYKRIYAIFVVVVVVVDVVNIVIISILIDVCRGICPIHILMHMVVPLSTSSFIILLVIFNFEWVFTYLQMRCVHNYTPHNSSVSLVLFLLRSRSIQIAFKHSQKRQRKTEPIHI